MRPGRLLRVTVVQLLLGAALLLAGGAMIAARRGISGREPRRAGAPLVAPVLWLFLGTLLAMNGLLLLLLALA